jgi:hypothetical protein
MMGTRSRGHGLATALPGAFAGVALYLLIGATGCRRSETPPAAPAAEAPRVEQMNLGAAQLTFTATPPRVHYERDLMLTIAASAPEGMELELPPLDDRLQGFTLGGFFSTEPPRSGERVTREYRARLTPGVAEEYRLAPMAVKLTDRRRTPAEETWVTTRPIVFEAAPPVEGAVPGDIDVSLKLTWIAPSFATVCGWVLAAAALAGVIWLAIRLARRVRREVMLRRMSPRERALFELNELLHGDLIQRNLFKEFYVELTMVVRRYIERRHGIRAPEQTTEEFLAAVASDPRFPAQLVARLRSFLQAADLVKFAAAHADASSADRAAQTAREYVEGDSQSSVTGDQ